MNVNVKKGVLWGIVLSLLFGLYFAFETYFFWDKGTGFLSRRKSTNKGVKQM